MSRLSSPLQSWAELDKGEDLHVYVRRLHEKALDCCDLVEEEILLNVCLHDRIKEYSIFLENLSFPSCSKLMEDGRRTNELVCRTSRCNAATRPSHLYIV